jgi:pimeloyl-ACP methyl ester carboxylesterase
MSATTLILLHGYPFDHTMWDKVLAALPADTKVITPDLPGFGQTPPGAKEPSLDVMADEIAKLLEGQKIPQAVLAGFSMGGYVALSFAERCPDRVAGLALINSQALADTDEVRAGRRTIIQKIREQGPRAATEAALPKLFGAANANNPELIRYPIEGANKAGVTGITWALEAMARRPDRTVIVQRLPVPLLILHTTEDKFIPVERARDLAKQKPSARYVEVAGAGHCSPLEAPEDVARALLELLKRVEEKPDSSVAVSRQSAVD